MRSLVGHITVGLISAFVVFPAVFAAFGPEVGSWALIALGVTCGGILVWVVIGSIVAGFRGILIPSPEALLVRAHRLPKHQAGT